MLLVRSGHVMCSLKAGSRDDSPRRVDSPSWQLTLHGHSSDDWPTCELFIGELRICSSLK